MITEGELRSAGFLTMERGSTKFYDNQWSAMFDLKTQQLYSHCEVYGDLEKISKPKRIEDLIEDYYNHFGFYPNKEVK